MQANRDRSRWQKWPSALFWVAFMPTAHTVTAIKAETAVKRQCARCFFTFTLAEVVFSLHQWCEPSLKSLINNKDATTEQIKSPRNMRKKHRETARMILDPEGAAWDDPVTSFFVLFPQKDYESCFPTEIVCGWMKVG